MRGKYNTLDPNLSPYYFSSFTPPTTGIILSGSPYSVYDTDAPHVDPAVFELGVPVLGICYGLQEMAILMGGKVDACDHREYGHASLTIVKHTDHPFADLLFDGLEGDIQVWRS